MAHAATTILALAAMASPAMAITCGAAPDNMRFAGDSTADTECESVYCGGDCNIIYCENCFTEAITCGAVPDDTKRFAGHSTADTECGNDCSGCFEFIQGTGHFTKRAGGIDFDWNSGVASAGNRAVTLKKGDTIKFSWTGTHDVFKFEDTYLKYGNYGGKCSPIAAECIVTAKQQFDDCDFTNAVRVGASWAGAAPCATVADGSCTTGELRGDLNGLAVTNYYACSVRSGGHCKDGQKLAVTVEEVPSALSAMYFCHDYITKCAAQPDNFADTREEYVIGASGLWKRSDTCETWYEAADDGVLANADTVYSNTKACYQQNLRVSNDNARVTRMQSVSMFLELPLEVQAIHCAHARGTAKCVAPPAPDCTLAMHATEADAITCSDDGKAHKMGDKWGSEKGAAVTAAASAFAVVAAVATAFW